VQGSIKPVRQRLPYGFFLKKICELLSPISSAATYRAKTGNNGICRTEFAPQGKQVDRAGEPDRAVNGETVVFRQDLGGGKNSFQKPIDVLSGAGVTYL
jgi:hypothetical protein